MESKKRKPGRPALGADAKRAHISIKVEPSLRAAAESAAAANARSLTQEIEYRLDQSFQQEEAAGGMEPAEMVRGIVAIMNSVSQAAGPEWWEQHWSWKLVRDTIDRLIRDYEPRADDELTGLLSPSGLETIKRWEDGLEKPLHSRPHAVKDEIDRLTLKADLAGLTDEEEERLSALKQSDQTFPLPELSAEDMAAWQVWGRRKQLQNRAVEHLMRIIMSSRIRRSKRLEAREASDAKD